MKKVSKLCLNCKRKLDEYSTNGYCNKCEEELEDDLNELYEEGIAYSLNP